MDTNNEIQSTPHSPDPMWRADSPSEDHASPSLELNHDGLSESQLEVSVTGSEGLQRGTSMNEDGHLELAVIDVNGGNQGVRKGKVLYIMPYLYCLVPRGSRDAPIFEMPSVPLG